MANKPGYNPFQILNIDKKLVRGLTPDKLDQLIASLGKALRVIHHPDQGGDVEKFKEVGTALDLLDRTANPMGFREWKELYLKQSKTAAVNVETNIAGFEARIKKLEEMIYELLAVPFSIPAAVKLNMHDPVKQLRFGINPSFVPDGAFYKLSIATDGHLTRLTPKEKKSLDLGRRFWGTIPQEVFQRKSVNPKVLFERREPSAYAGTPRLTNSRVIQGKFGGSRNPFGRPFDQRDYLVNREVFSRFLTEVRRDIRQNSYFFSIDEKGELYIDGLSCHQKNS